MANTLADTNALHVNASAGIQGNHTQIGGSHNRQYNAETIHVKNISARPETPPSPSSTLLPRPDPNFVDREKLLEHIRARSSVLGAWVALVGLGGVGKTQIATRYVQRLRAEDPNLWILWILASNAPRFDESVVEIADQIRLPGRQDPQTNILRLLQNWLNDAKRRWMIVLDNTDDVDFLLDNQDAVDAVHGTKSRIEYFPKCDHGSVLLTSRDKTAVYNFVSEDSVVEVIPMDTKQAEMLLQKKLGALCGPTDYGRLAKALDFIPLALSQAASFIRQKRRYTVESYLAELERSREARTSLLPSATVTRYLTFSYGGYTHKKAGKIADAAAEDDIYDETRFDDDIQVLEDFSFVSANADLSFWDMHRLVQDATQWWLVDHGEVKAAEHDFIRHLHEVTPTGEYENWQICQTLMPHIKSALELNIGKEDVSLLWADVMYKAACFTDSQGSYREAEGMAERSLHIRMGRLGPEHPDTLNSMANLATTYGNQGRWTDAEKLEVNVIEISKTKLGLNHPDTLTSMANLAVIYWNRGRWAEAEQLQIEVIKTKKTKLGFDHPNTLTSIANLCVVYMQQSRWADAEQLQVEVIEISKTKFKLDHPSMLISIANLASIYWNQGRWTEAEQLEIEVIEISKTKLGLDHPDTLTSMANLAAIYRGQGRWADAEQLQVEMTEMRKKAFGAEDVTTLTAIAGMNLRKSETMEGG